MARDAVTHAGQLAYLKRAVFDMKNEHCFVERERFLNSITPPAERPSDFYARTLAGLLGAVSTPVDANDIFVGRVAEDEPEGDAPCPCRILESTGHMTPDYGRLLTLGYRGILAGIKENAARVGGERARIYAENAEIVAEAMRSFAARYAEAARAAGNERAYRALLRVPYKPAYDLYSALQSIWLVHMTASCYVGSRDYAFGYADEYLYPYYLIEKANGATDDEVREILAGFLLKTNEICGCRAHNYRQKPVPSQSAKQYLLLDGGRANELSSLILDAAELNRLAQPELTVLLSDDSPEPFRRHVTEAMSRLTDKVQVYNYKLLRAFLERRGLPDEISSHPAFSACCTFDLNYRSIREEFYLPTVQLFCDTLFRGDFSSEDELLTAFGAAVRAECEKYLDDSRNRGDDYVRMAFVLDALLLGGCNEHCDYPPRGLDYRVKNIFLPGIATLGDSLYSLRRLVFDGGELRCRELADIVKNDYASHEKLRERVLALPKFGNDDAADDDDAVKMANVMLDAVEQARHMPEELVVPAFYSLERDNVWAASLPATPDGRRAGSPISENQSPTYGADKQGLTALLNSLARLPFGRTAAGGLNLTFTSHSAISPEILSALIKTYFEAGGLHIGITRLCRAELEDAMRHPEKYPTLTVRLYGFSEYFVSLPEWQQLAVLNRTEY